MNSKLEIMRTIIELDKNLNSNKTFTREELSKINQNLIEICMFMIEDSDKGANGQPTNFTVQEHLAIQTVYSKFENKFDEIVSSLKESSAWTIN